MIDQYITRRHKYLLKTALLIVSKNNRSKNKNEDASDLLSYCVEYFCSNREKTSNKSDQDIENMMCGFMYNQWQWNNSTSRNSFLNQQKMINRNSEPIEDRFFDCYDKQEVNNIELAAEEVPDNIRNYIQDLINSGYSNDSISKILSTKQCYTKLNITEQSLYDLYFIKDHAMRDIAKIANVPLTYVFKILKDIKEKIKLNYETTKA